MPEAEVVAVVAVSRVVVQRQAVASPRGRQLANPRSRHHGGKPDRNNLACVIEILVIARTTGTMRVKIASNTEMKHVKIARTTMMTIGITTTIIIIIMVAQPL
jgi:hypothetical protein